MDDTERARNVGTLLKNFSSKHTREYAQGLTLDENTILQKLVSEGILTARINMKHKDGKTRTHTGIRVESESYLKALIFLDYYSTVVDESMSACNYLITLAIKLRELSQESGNLVLDLNLETVVLEVGLVAQQRYSESPNSSQPDNIAQRYIHNNAFIGNAHLRKIEPYYQAIGLRVVEMLSPERRQYFDGVANRSDLEAVIFTDCVLGVLKNQQTIDLIKQDIPENKLKASITALDAIRKEATLERLRTAIKGGYK